MLLRFNPQGTPSFNSVITVSGSTLTVDGYSITIPDNDGEWIGIDKESNGFILEAKRVNGVAYATVCRCYTGSCQEWDTGDYHDVGDGTI